MVWHRSADVYRGVDEQAVTHDDAPSDDAVLAAVGVPPNPGVRGRTFGEQLAAQHCWLRLRTHTYGTGRWQVRRYGVYRWCKACERYVRS